MRIPEQLRSVLTVLLNPEVETADLSSVVPDERGGAHLATRELLNRAVDTLIARITDRGAPVERILHPCTIVRRGSVGPPEF